MREQFKTNVLNGAGLEQSMKLSRQFDELLTFVEQTIPKGRYPALVATKLQEALAFAERGLATNAEYVLNPEPSDVPEPKS